MFIYFQLTQGSSVKEQGVLEKYSFNATKDESSGAAYMITKRWGYPWAKLPPLVIGEPDLEAFYVSKSIYFWCIILRDKFSS